MRPRPRICCTARRRWLPTRTGTLASFGPAETTRVTSEPWVAVCAGRRFGVDHQSFFDRVGVDGFDLDLEAGGFELFARLFARQPGGRRHLAAAGAGADRQGHRRLRAEEGEEGAVERGLVAGRRGGGILLEHGVRRRFALDPLAAPTEKPSCWSRAIATLSWLPVTSGTSVVVSRVSARPISRPIRTAAIAAAIQRRRRLRASSSGSAPARLDRGRDHRRQRREVGRAVAGAPVPSGPRRGRR